MDLSHVPAGRNPPSDLNAIIEIPVGGAQVKYELDKASGAMFVDLAVPVDALNPAHTDIHSYLDLPKILREQISYLFEHYKDLDEERWSRVGDWVDVKDAERIVMDAIGRAKKHK